jgi:GMP synthase-like glutamine amidotransferase
MRIGDHIFTVQGHPEFTTSYSSKLINMRKHLYDQELLDISLASLEQKTDELMVAKAIRKFLLA